MPTFHERSGAVEMGRLDGNAAAGALSEVFAIDLTAVTVGCGSCGATGPFAEVVVEMDDDGLIVLCRSCGHTLLTYLNRAGRMSLSVRGLAFLESAAG